MKSAHPLNFNCNYNELVETFLINRKFKTNIFQENAVVHLQDTDDEDLIASAFAATDTVKPSSQPKPADTTARVVTVSNDQQTTVSKKRQSLIAASSNKPSSGAPMATDRPVRVTNQPFATNRDMIKKDVNKVVGKPPGGATQHTMSKAYYDKASAGG